MSDWMGDLFTFKNDFVRGDSQRNPLCVCVCYFRIGY